MKSDNFYDAKLKRDVYKALTNQIERKLLKIAPKKREVKAILDSKPAYSTIANLSVRYPLPQIAQGATNHKRPAPESVN